MYLSRAVVEMAELAGGLAHELRNPLSTMMINLKLLSEDLQDVAAQTDDMRRRALRKVEVLRQEAERLQSLFDEFLSLTGSFRLQCAPTDVNSMVDRLRDFFEPVARSGHVDMIVRTRPGPLVCPVDVKLLNQALLNIVLNAEQAMPNGGVLCITTDVEAEWVVISVADTGVGIAEKDRDQVLRPFFSTKATGSGLGLSITQRIVGEHGGTLSFESEPGAGTTFRVRLPLHSRDVPAEQPA